MKIHIVVLIFFFLGCGPQYLDDPNSYVLVTSQYEDEPVEIVRTSKCKPMVDCTNKTKAECAIAHYHDAQQYIYKGEEMASKRLYMSASLEYILALCRLEAAKILSNEAKLSNFKEYKRVISANLEEKIKEKIALCDRKISSLRWE